MDGVTDAACRYIQATTAKPDVMFTEFITTEGLFYRPEAILPEFEYQEMERPIVAQIYGPNPGDFYKAALVVCALEFDGVDINMGCPSKAVVKRGCGAKLITMPEMALQIIESVKRAIEDWSNGMTLEEGGIDPKISQEIDRMNQKRLGKSVTPKRQQIPYSVKTRIGYSAEILNQWLPTLLSTKPAVISLHGRTLKQMYEGRADWEAISRAAEIIHQTETLVLGNGDVKSLQEAHQRVFESKVDGVLIGRAAIGNPWVFSSRLEEIGRGERVAKAAAHAEYWDSIRGNRYFKKINRHLSAYLKGFDGASLLRQEAMKAVDFTQLCRILSCF